MNYSEQLDKIGSAVRKDINSLIVSNGFAPKFNNQIKVIDITEFSSNKIKYLGKRSCYDINGNIYSYFSIGLEDLAMIVERFNSKYGCSVPLTDSEIEVAKNYLKSNDNTSVVEQVIAIKEKYAEGENGVIIDIIEGVSVIDTFKDVFQVEGFVNLILK